jgi:hypothetical protein
MMTNETSAEVYRLHVWIHQISPMIWRRLLVRSDSTIADLHYTIQIAFGWSDEHLNMFHIHGQDYGVYHEGGISFSTDPDQVRLRDFKFRDNERFRYEYNFSDCWRHEVCIEAREALKERRVYPCCIGGQRRAPPEECGGPLAFMAGGMKSRGKLMTYWRTTVTILKPTIWKPFAGTLQPRWPDHHRGAAPLGIVPRQGPTRPPRGPYPGRCNVLPDPPPETGPGG